MNATINSVLTDKGYEIVLNYAEDSYIYEDYEIFGEGMEFRFRGMDWASSQEMKGIGEEIITRALGFSDLYAYNEYEEEEIDTEAKKLIEKYWIFPISTYEHSLYAFHPLYGDELRGNDGAMFLDKKYFSKREFEKVKKFLEGNFTDFFNGNLYDLSVFKPHKYTDDNGEVIYNRDYEISSGPLFYEDIEDTYKSEFEEEYGKMQKSILAF